MFNNSYTPLNRIYLNRTALLHNIEVIKKMTNKDFYFPVLKSNAYGHGLHEIYSMIKDMNFPLVCVDSIYEAFQIYEVNSKQEVLIMGYIDPENLHIKKLPFQYVVWSGEQIEKISKYQHDAKFHIFIDTGMNREGIHIDELEKLCKELPDNIIEKIVGVLSHFSTADELVDKSYEKQNIEFEKALEIVKNNGITPKYIHIEATSGLLRKLNDRANSVRMGIGMYGISPVLNEEFNLTPILRFTTTIVQVKELKIGDKVGYGGTFEAPNDMKISILPVGYNDGVDRRLSNLGVVKIKDKYCKILGNVSMNIIVVDITDVPDALKGDEVEIFSDNTIVPNSILESSKICNTIPYDLLVHINPSTRREIVE